MKNKLDKLEIYELTEVLTSVQYQFGLNTELEARQNIEAGEYTKEEILDAIAYKRTDGLGNHKARMEYLPTSLKGVQEDYSELL